MFNQVYVVAPNLGSQIQKDGSVIDLFGGQSMIVNNCGTIVAKQAGWTPGDCFVNTVIDMESLRKIRTANGLYNQFKDLRTEQYAAIYSRPITEEPVPQGAP